MGEGLGTKHNTHNTQYTTHTHTTHTHNTHTHTQTHTNTHTHTLHVSRHTYIVLNSRVSSIGQQVLDNVSCPSHTCLMKSCTSILQQERGGGGERGGEGRGRGETTLTCKHEAHMAGIATLLWLFNMAPFTTSTLTTSIWLSMHALWRGVWPSCG